MELISQQFIEIVFEENYIMFEHHRSLLAKAISIITELYKKDAFGSNSEMINRILSELQEVRFDLV